MAAQTSGKVVQSYLMRTSGPQPFFTQPFATLSTFNIPKNIPLQLPLSHIIIRWKGRMTTTAAFTPSPEAPQNILQRVQLQGTHASLGFLMPIQMSGASLFMMNKILTKKGNGVYITNATLATAATTGVRVVQEGQQQVGLVNAGGSNFYYNAPTWGAAATAYDMQIFWTIPLYPYGLPDGAAVQYLYNAAAWGQTLQLQIQTADQTAFNTTAANAPFTAFGSASGSPAIDIMTVYAQLGPLRNSIAQAVNVRNTYSISSILQTNANNQRLQLLQNQRTQNIIVKTGTSLAGTSAGVSAFGTLSDTILEQTYARLNNNPIRNLQYNDTTKEFYGYRFDTVLPQGYLNISFEDSQPLPNVFAGLRGERLPGSTQFDVASNVVGAAGTNVGEVIQDMIYGEPVVVGASTPSSGTSTTT
jgi:hypothetical protein